MHMAAWAADLAVALGTSDADKQTLAAEKSLADARLK